MTNREVFKQTCLPPKEAFYSNFKFEGISDKDFQRAQEMWKRYGCETMQDFHDVYLGRRGTTGTRQRAMQRS